MKLTAETRQQHQIDMQIRAARMKEMYDQGHTYKSIGERFDMTKSRVGQIFKQFGYKPRPKENNNRRFSS